MTALVRGTGTVLPCPDRFLSFRVNAMWLEHSGFWLVGITKAFTNSDSEYAETEPWTRRYGVAEAPTAIDATTLALSDYRTGR